MRWPRRRTPRDVYSDRRAARTIAAATARRAAKQGALWGLVFGGTIAASASSYAVPAADPNWTAAAWLVGLGLLAATAGIAAFGRRDLVSA